LPIGGYHGFKGFLMVLAGFSWFFTQKNLQKLFLLIPDATTMHGVSMGGFFKLGSLLYDDHTDLRYVVLCRYWWCLGFRAKCIVLILN
jgi:hypothetical protein